MLKRAQLTYARCVLRTTNHTGTQIAYKAGFGTRNTFYRRLRGQRVDPFRRSNETK
ncbi:MAG: hypothetical protein JJE51_11375 [Thermoanaerobaculia bacterium]|nr:hypothetical protein [Thermoanaerobaculia bacterium]